MAYANDTGVRQCTLCIEPGAGNIEAISIQRPLSNFNALRLRPNVNLEPRLNEPARAQSEHVHVLALFVDDVCGD